jgi:hypothetical protein
LDSQVTEVPPSVLRESIQLLLDFTSSEASSPDP